MTIKEAEEHFHRGIHYFRGGFFPAALQEFQAVARIDPQFGNIQHFLTVTRKKTEEVAGQLSAFLHEAFDDQAHQLSEQLVIEDSPHFGREIERLLRREEYQAALTKLADAEAFVSESRPFLLLKANVFKRLGRFADAEQILLRAHTLFPEDAEIINNLGNVYLARNHFNEARDRFEAALKLNPDDPRALNNLGTLYMQIHNLDRAQSVFERLVREHPNWQVARRNLEGLLRRKEELEKEIFRLRQELIAHPTYIDIGMNLGKNLFFRGFFTEARLTLESVLRQNPSMHAAQFYLGSICEIEGDFQKALERYYAMCVARQQDDSPAFINSQRLREEGYLEEALAEVKKVAVLELDLASGHIKLGIRYFEDGQWDNAQEHFDEAVKLKPKYPDAYYWRALTRLRTGKKASAEKDLRKAIELNPRFADAHYQLGMLSRDKAPRKARFHLQAAISMGVRAQFAEIAERLLKTPDGDDEEED
ncbi:MAG TPA: tetratricopeptide repeat protein [Candidatus Ozemobacteraceae bacterium]|nr:tetratricopeptide repeat protein [Candidatus Ozemobacteraceae bacterium]